MSDKIVSNPNALKSGEAVPPPSGQGSFQSCAWCAAKDAQIAVLEAEVERLKATQTFNDGLDDSVMRKLRQKIAQLEAEREAATKAWYAASDLVGKGRTALAPFVALVQTSYEIWKLINAGWSIRDRAEFKLFSDALSHPDVQRAVKGEK